MNYQIPSLLLSFLGACMYGDAAAFYGNLNKTECTELEAQAKSFGMTTWLYRYLHDVLPEEKRAELQKIYQAQQIKAIVGLQELKRLYGMLASHNLRFVPIKGSDLSYRLYPDTALRVFCDWDIWFHPDDCERALEVLKQDGWKVPDILMDDHENAIKMAPHHFSPHFRGQHVVEPHFTLANFEGIDPHEMWNETIEYSDGDGQRVLSPEMNLLMLTRHAASMSYYHAHLPKMLTDAAVIMQKEKVDFSKLRSMADRWHLPYSGDLLVAFPEFFPQNEIAKFEADSQKAAGFRRIFELRGELGEPNSEALLLGHLEAQGQMAGGILKHIRTLSPDRMRRICQLPKHGAWGSVAWAYLCYFCTRTWRLLFTWAQRDKLLQHYSEIIESIETNNRLSSQKK